MVFSEVANMEEPVYDVSRPLASVEMLFKFPLLNAPGKSILGGKVIFPPNASTPPHTHAGAFVAVHVLSGTVLNKMNDNPMTIKRAGDSFYEAPGCRHRISDNASATEEATLFVTFVLDTEKMDGILAAQGIMGLVVIDEEYKPLVMEKLAKMQAAAEAAEV